MASEIAAAAAACVERCCRAAVTAAAAVDKPSVAEDPSSSAAAAHRAAAAAAADTAASAAALLQCCSGLEGCLNAARSPARSMVQASNTIANKNPCSRLSTARRLCLCNIFVNQGQLVLAVMQYHAHKKPM